MNTIQLKISDKVYDRVIWLLSKFGSDEIEIVSDISEFDAASDYLKDELLEVENGRAKLISQEEFEKSLNESF
jgi:hypothetical protein